MKKDFGIITVLLGRELPNTLSDQQARKQRMSEVYAARLAESQATGKPMIMTEWHGVAYPHTGKPVAELIIKDDARVTDVEYKPYTVSLADTLDTVVENGITFFAMLVNKDGNYKVELRFHELHPDSEVVDASKWIAAVRAQRGEHKIKGVWINGATVEEEKVNLVLDGRPTDYTKHPTLDQMQIGVEDDTLSFQSCYVRKRTSFGKKVAPGAVAGLYQTQRDKEDAAAEAAKPKRHYHGPEGLAERAKEQGK